MNQQYEFESGEEDDSFDDGSVKSDPIDDQTMNVFGLNDDINLDDRIIV